MFQKSTPSSEYEPPRARVHRADKVKTPTIPTAESCKFCDDAKNSSCIISGNVFKCTGENADNISIYAFIDNDSLIISANNMTLKATINFCPMCGKELSNCKDEYNEEHDDDDDECESKCGHDCENANEIEYECECEHDCENECNYNELEDLLYAQALRHLLKVKQL